jgi:flagellar biosynthesis/type III secretory pathway protein FliH
VPRVRDPTAASHLPELAMLSVMAHPELEIAQAAIQAISGLPADRARLYLDVIMKALPAKARQIVEAQMIKGYQYQSDFARKYYGQGLEEGRDEGREEGREGLRGAVITLARAKLGKLSDDVVAAIEAVSDLRVLTELITSLGQTSSTRKARAALARVLAP